MCSRATALRPHRKRKCRRGRLCLHGWRHRPGMACGTGTVWPMTFFRHLTLGIAGGALLSAQAPDKEDDVKNPVAGKPEAVSAGRKLFLEGCSGCHGAEAEG